VVRFSYHHNEGSDMSTSIDPNVNYNVSLRRVAVVDLIHTLADALARDTGGDITLSVYVNEGNGTAFLSNAGNPPSVVGKIV
jgi:hypothetical protein